MTTVPGSRFDHDSEASVEEEEVEEGEEAGDITPQSPSHSATPEDNYIPESPPISPVELKKELPKYLPALQVRRHISVTVTSPHKRYVQRLSFLLLLCFRAVGV